MPSTLECRFDEREADARALGADDRFVRLWRYYLAYCEAGFAEGTIGLAHLVLERPVAAAAHGHVRPASFEAVAGGRRPDAALVDAEGRVPSAVDASDAAAARASAAPAIRITGASADLRVPTEKLRA